MLYKKTRCSYCGGIAKRRNVGAMLVDCHYCEKTGFILKPIEIEEEKINDHILSSEKKEDKIDNNPSVKTDIELNLSALNSDLNYAEVTTTTQLLNETKTGRKIKHV